MSAPSIKEALELKPCPFCGGEAWMLNGGPGNWFVQCTQCKCTTNDVQRDHAAALWNTRATLSPPAGERGKALEEAVRHQLEIYRMWGNSNEAAKAIADAILASGFVQDEVAIRADERKKQKERDANFVANWFHPDSKNLAERLASAIRSARDGGAET